LSPGVSPAEKGHSLVVGEHFQKQYDSLDPHMQQMISSHPLVAGGHISPSAALNILHYDKKPGEQIGDVVARSFIQRPPMSRVSSPGLASASMPTGMPGRRQNQSSFATGIG
jgi:hypothetical protein